MSKINKQKISRIVKQKISLLDGVHYTREGGRVFFKGPAGELSIFFNEAILINQEGNSLSFSSNKVDMPILGTMVVLFKNAMNGVHKKFEKVMNLYGVGYKVVSFGRELEFFLGYSHSIKIFPPDDISFEIKTPTQIILNSCSKSSLGDFAAKISKLRRMNPYKTKGIIEKDGFILKKEGKK